MTRLFCLLLTLLFSLSGPAMGENSDFRRCTLVIKTTPEFVNLASPQRTTHILTGDATGGGHLFPGGAGKSAFPQSWSADRVMHEISDVATDPLSSFVTGRGGRTVVNGTRDGIDLRVILGSPREGGGIITGFPTNVPRNP